MVVLYCIVVFSYTFSVHVMYHYNLMKGVAMYHLFSKRKENKSLVR